MGTGGPKDGDGGERDERSSQTDSDTQFVQRASTGLGGSLTGSRPTKIDVGTDGSTGLGGSLTGNRPSQSAASAERPEAYYGVDPPNEAVLQRLRANERMYGERVHDWVDEGMPTDIMGKTNDMKAFRERQAERPDDVPTDIERQNEFSLQRSAKAAADTSPAGDAGVPDSVRSVISSPGASLGDDVRSEMESRMGDSFDDVRIHTGPTAANACEDVDARAFTVGNHVAFNRGEYDPGSPEGKHVLAHELAHVRQQTQGSLQRLEADADIEIADSNAPEERAAERQAEAALESGDTPSRATPSPVGVQRMGKDERLDDDEEKRRLARRLWESGDVGRLQQLLADGTLEVYHLPDRAQALLGPGTLDGSGPRATEHGLGPVARPDKTRPARYENEPDYNDEKILEELTSSGGAVSEATEARWAEQAESFSEWAEWAAEWSSELNPMVWSARENAAEMKELGADVSVVDGEPRFERAWEKNVTDVLELLNIPAHKQLIETLREIDENGMEMVQNGRGLALLSALAHMAGKPVRKAAEELRNNPRDFLAELVIGAGIDKVTSLSRLLGKPDATPEAGRSLPGAENRVTDSERLLPPGNRRNTDSPRLLPVPDYGENTGSQRLLPSGDRSGTKLLPPSDGRGGKTGSSTGKASSTDSGSESKTSPSEADSGANSAVDLTEVPGIDSDDIEWIEDQMSEHGSDLYSDYSQLKHDLRGLATATEDGQKHITGLDEMINHAKGNSKRGLSELTGEAYVAKAIVDSDDIDNSDIKIQYDITTDDLDEDALGNTGLNRKHDLKNVDDSGNKSPDVDVNILRGTAFESKNYDFSFDEFKKGWNAKDDFVKSILGSEINSLRKKLNTIAAMKETDRVVLVTKNPDAKFPEEVREKFPSKVDHVESLRHLASIVESEFESVEVSVKSYSEVRQ